MTPRTVLQELLGLSSTSAPVAATEDGQTRLQLTRQFSTRAVRLLRQLGTPSLKRRIGLTRRCSEPSR